MTLRTDTCSQNNSNIKHYDEGMRLIWCSSASSAVDLRGLISRYADLQTQLSFPVFALVRTEQLGQEGEEC